MSFIASEDWNLTWKHLPDYVYDDQSGKKFELNTEQKTSIANDAERVWNIMIDSFDQRIPMLHDGYLKLFHLQVYLKKFSFLK